MFPELNLIPGPLKIQKRQNQLYVLDPWRKKEVVLNPEEWVRQHLLYNLVSAYNYPTERIAVEMQINTGNLKRRCDAVVFDLNGNPELIVECKEPDVLLNQEVVYQIAQYNTVLNTRWLLISNGLQHITLHIGDSAENITLFEGIVDYAALKPEF